MSLVRLLQSLVGSLRRARRSQARAVDWSRIEEVLGIVLEAPPERRAALLDTLCGGDPGVRAEVSVLLDAGDASGLIDRPLDELVASLFSPQKPDVVRAARAPIVSHYELLERLQGGGMGVIYHARDVRLARPVALKFLPMALTADERAKARFLLEARAAAALDHRNVCAIHEVGESEDGQLFIAMPFYEGETLADRIAREPLPVGNAIAIALQVLQGLEHAHQRGIVHRDIKPANIMLTPEGLVKILDFGIVKHGEVGFTRSGVLLGTLPYMSPEQLGRQAVDARSDVWSVGVVLYEMLAGRPPFAGADAHRLREAILFSQPESPRMMRPDVPQELARAIAVALAKHVDDRYPDARAFASALETIQRMAAVQALEIACAPARPEERPDVACHPRVPTVPQVLPGGERRQTTIAVSGLSGFAEVVERCAPNEVEHVIRRLKQEAWDIVDRHGGTINEFSEDRVVLLFGVPASIEDHCARAVHAAIDLHALVRSWRTSRSGASRLALRTAIDSGEAAVQRAEGAMVPYRIAGRPVSRAIQLCAHARTDEILISPQAGRAVASLFELMPADPLSLPEDVEAMTPQRVLRPSAPQDPLEHLAVRAALTPFTGRGAELQTLVQALESLRNGEGRFVAITGDAGLGKSRLLLEFRRTIDSADIAVLVGRCSAYGQATAYMPFVDVLRQLFALDPVSRGGWTDEIVAAGALAVDSDLEEFIPFYLRLLSVPTEKYRLPTSLPDEQLRLALEEALVAALAACAARGPLALLFEDWHWADAASNGVLKQAADLVSTRRLLIVTTSRVAHDIDSRHRQGDVVLELLPLEPASTAAMLKAVLDADVLPEELSARIYERSGGNPFFVEEIGRSLAESGTLRTIGRRITLAGSLEALDLPATVQAVIRTRVDRLDLDARQALRAASVMGREFTRPVVERAMADGTRAESALDRLIAAGIIQRTSGVLEDGYRFGHALMQEAAYAGLLEHQRAELHARIGAAIEDIYSDQLDEWLFRLAQHFSVAEQWPKAVQYGLRSVERMTELCQFVAALQVLDRTREWLDMLDEHAQHETAIDILFRQERLCDTLGIRDRQRQIVEELIARIESGSDRTELPEAYVRKGDLHTNLRQFVDAEEALQRSLSLRRETDDAAGERTTLRSLGFLRWCQERYGDALAYVNEALAIDRRENNVIGTVGDLHNLAAIHRATGNHEESLLCLEEGLRLSKPPDRDGAPWPVDLRWHNMHVQHAYGSLLAERGELDRALDHLTRPVAWIRKARLGVQAAFFYTAIAQVHFRKGNLQACFDYYRQAIEWTRKGRYQTGLATSLRLLGELLLSLGREQEALGHLREAAAVFGELQDRSAEALMWARVGTAEQRLGNLGHAASAWERTRILRHEAGDARGELEALEALAGIARRHRPAADALGFYEAAIAVAVTLDDRLPEARLRNAAGIIEWTRGRHAEALRHFERGLELYQAFGDCAGTGLMMNSIGVTLSALGRSDAARVQLEGALLHHRGTGQPQLEAHALAALGDLSWEATDADAASEWYQRSLDKRRSLEDVRGEGWMLHRLARIRALRGERDQADAMLARAAELSMRCSDEELMAACAELRRQATGIRVEGHDGSAGDHEEVHGGRRRARRPGEGG